MVLIYAPRAHITSQGMHGHDLNTCEVPLTSLILEQLSPDMCSDITRERYFRGLHKTSPSGNISEPAGECQCVNIWISTHLNLPVFQ